MPEAAVAGSDRRLEIDGRRGTVAPASSLFEAAAALGARVPTSCGAQGRCRECLIEVEAGGELLTPREPQEEGLLPGFRLSCRARFAHPGRVRAHTLRRGALRIEEDSAGLEGDAELDPRYRRRGETLLRDGREVGTIGAAPLGIALDLGTTTVVLRLFDLESGAAIATRSFENPQRFGGSDVMARIRYDSEHPGRLLQRVLLGYLGRAIEELPRDSRDVVEVVVAGNTTMRDLFFGIDVHPIGQLPYRSRTEHELREGRRATTSLETPARRLRLPLHPEATVYGLPLVASHVGADAAACLLATGLGEREGLAMAMDIGTNTEVLLGNRDRILAASCPAGPAFEGGGVRCGAPALDGAIERVQLRPDGGLELGVIGDREPIGLCGSGLVDLLGELRRTGRLNARGRYADGASEFVVHPAGPIVLTESDVNELAQAKGANAAGLRIVAASCGVELAEIERFYLAGGFGRHLDLAAARRIGLIPDLPDERIRAIGNASLTGAARALLSVGARRRLEQLLGRVEHVALESHPRFFDHFVDGCQLEPFGGPG